MPWEGIEQSRSRGNLELHRLDSPHCTPNVPHDVLPIPHIRALVSRGQVHWLKPASFRFALRAAQAVAQLLERCSPSRDLRENVGVCRAGVIAGQTLGAQ